MKLRKQLRFRVAIFGLALGFIGLGKTSFGQEAAASEPVQTDAVIERAFDGLEQRFAHFAQSDPEQLGNVFEQAFGGAMSTGKVAEWTQLFAKGAIPRPARVVLVDPEVLAGAEAAYASKDGGLILLTASLRNHPERLETFLIEEYGHFIDDLLGEGDSPGDEGEIFWAGIAQGAPLSGTQLSLLRLQEDHAILTFEGQSLEVELGLWSKIKGGVNKAASWTKKAVTVSIPNTGAAIGQAWASAGKSAFSSATSAVVNLGGSAVNLVRATGNQFGAFGAALAGDFERAERLNSRADSQYKKAGNQALGGLGNVVDVMAAPGDAYNATVGELNKLVPHLGTVFDIGASIGLSMINPSYAVYLATAKGVSDVNSAYKNGGTKAALIAGGFAAIDIGASAAGAKLTKLGKLDDVALATKADAAGMVKRAAATSKYIDDAVRTGRMVDPMAKAGRLTRFGRSIPYRANKFAYNTGLVNVTTRKFLYPKAATIGGLGKLFVPGRDRNAVDNSLLGSGGNTFKARKVHPGSQSGSRVDLSQYGGTAPATTLPRPRSPLFPKNNGSDDSTRSLIESRQLGPNGGLFGPFVQPPPAPPTPVEPPREEPVPVFIAPLPPVVVPTPPPPAAPTPPPVVPPTGGTGG